MLVAQRAASLTRTLATSSSSSSNSSSGRSAISTPSKLSSNHHHHHYYHRSVSATAAAAAAVATGPLRALSFRRAPLSATAAFSHRRARTLHTSTPAMFALSKFRGNAADQPKTFSRQDALPRLPVPPLAQTFERYLQTLEPILAQAEAMGTLPSGATAQSELDKRRQWAQEAIQPGSLVQRLQQRLVDVDRTTPNNWLDDRFWLQKAYHEWRVPLLVNSNWWLMFRADADTPAAALEATSAQGGASGAEIRSGDTAPNSDMAVALGTNDWTDAAWGVRRAAWLTYRLLLFKQRLDAEDIMPDASRAAAFCMHQYTRLFGVTRIPAIPHDYNSEAPHPVPAKHITVMARNNIYTLRVLDDKGLIVPVADIETAMTAIIEDARKQDGKAVGVLSSGGRDDWARSREHLLSISPQNRTMVNAIEDSLFTVSLDSSVLPLPKDHADVAHASTPASVDAHARNCSGAGRGGLNRWFDKSMTLVVEPNGRAGIMGEHSPCDALIPSIVGEFAAAVPAPKPAEALPAGLPGTASAPPPTESGSLTGKLVFETDAQTDASIAAAFAEARRIASESDVGELWFDEYGTDWIKKQAKQSPDAFIQQVLQLAYARVKGMQEPTYETASTRMFKHGRTDVIRSFSRESYAFVQAVRQGKASGAEMYKLLSAATKAHNAQTRASSMGGGVDRHLTGLRLVYDANEDGSLPGNDASSGAVASAGVGGGASSPAGRALPPNFYKGAELLFADELLGGSQTWKLSTSGLSAGNLLAGTGFGSGFLDGYGINYLTGSHLLKFGIESKHPAPRGAGELGNDPTNRLAREIVWSLRFLRALCEREAPASTPDSKM